MGCEAYIDDDLLEGPWCESCINSYSDTTREDSNDDYITADEQEVWSLAYEKIYLPTILTPSWYFRFFDHFVALSVGYSFFDSPLYDIISVE